MLSGTSPRRARSRSCSSTGAAPGAGFGIGVIAGSCGRARAGGAGRPDTVYYTGAGGGRKKKEGKSAAVKPRAGGERRGAPKERQTTKHTKRHEKRQETGTKANRPNWYCFWSFFVSFRVFRGLPR